MKMYGFCEGPKSMRHKQIKWHQRQCYKQMYYKKTNSPQTHINLRRMILMKFYLSHNL